MPTVACMLTSRDLARQRDRWQMLAAKALIERIETDRGIRISFRDEPGVADELRELVAVENECCSWARWTVEASAEEIVLDVSSTRDGIPVLHGMFTS